MRSYLILMTSMGAVFLALFGLVEVLQVPGLANPEPLFAALNRPAAAAAGVALLVVDVLLPVPASFVMVLNGTLFGVAGGTALSLVGGVAAAAVGFALGRLGSGSLDRWVSQQDRARADELLGRYGELAIIASRPVPILAESVAIIAGTTHLSWARLLVSAIAGTLPVAWLYALTGASAAQFDSFVLTFGLVLLVAGAVWLGGQRLRARR